MSEEDSFFCAIKTGAIESWKKTKKIRKNEWVEEKKIVRKNEKMRKENNLSTEWMKGGLIKN